VHPKAVMFPTDTKFIHRALGRLVRLAKKLGFDLRQSYRRVAKLALIRYQRYAHVMQFKRANRLRKLKTYLDRIMRDIGRKIASEDKLQGAFVPPSEDQLAEFHDAGQLRAPSRWAPSVSSTMRAFLAPRPWPSPLNQESAVAANIAPV
jgi:hypothetical protein